MVAPAVFVARVNVFLSDDTVTVGVSTRFRFSSDVLTGFETDVGSLA